MIFTHWSIVFPVLIFFLDIIYQVWLIIKSIDNMYNGWYALGIISEVIGIALLISYFFMTIKNRNCFKKYFLS